MFCDSDTAFLSEDQYWNTTDPDFSPCFQKTALLWYPCAFLNLFAPIRILQLYKSKHKHIIPWSWRSRTKLGLAFVIGLLCTLDIGKGVYLHFSGTTATVPLVDFLSPLIVILTMVVYCIVVHFERKNSIRSSGFLFLFWFQITLVSMVTFRSKIREALSQVGVEDMFTFVTFYIFFAILLAQLVLSCVVDKQPVGAVPIEDENPCPEHYVSFLSQITFWWFTSLVVQGYKRALVQTDLWNLNPDDKCSNVTPAFDVHWQKELNKCKRLHHASPSPSSADAAGINGIEMKDMSQNQHPEVKITEVVCKKKKPRLFWAMLKTFGLKCLISAAYKFVYDVLQFISPLLLKFLITYTRDASVETWKGYWYAALMLVVAMFQSVVLHMYFYHCTVVGMRLRTSIISTVYQKMLKLSSAAKRTSTVGEIVNLMSVDAQRFNDMMTYIHIIWSGPVQIILSIYFLWVTLGPSIVAGLGMMIVFIPLNAVIANKFKVYQVAQMKLKDTRIKMMNEILNGIKVLKLYAWEKSFEDKVLDIRNKELNILKKMSYLNAITTFTWTVAPFLVTLVTFAVYVMVDVNNILDAEKAFVSLALFNILRFPLSMIPQVISNIVQVRVSLSRLSKFLGNDELDPEAVIYDENTKHSIAIKDGNFAWQLEGPTTLKNINLSVPTGSLVAVVGTVGSGKSSLLHAILGEMENMNGLVTIKGSTAYVAQQAWIQNATVQDNILFGKPAELNRYRRVIEACALQPDLEIMSAGDQTEIGEKGINLSGGQKQRVSLARAAYQDTDVYLLDDPLSAVDSHVGKHIFDNVIGPEGMLKEKTRVLVTHGVGFLPQVDTIVVLVDGQVSEMGSYKELLSHDGAFAQFLKNYITEEMKKDHAEDLEIDEETISQIGSYIGDSFLQRQVSVLSERIRTMSDAAHSTHEMSPPGTPDMSGRRPGSPNLSSNAKRNGDHRGSKGNLSKQKSVIEVPKNVDKKDEEKKLIEAEKMETETVKLSVFSAYLKSVGILLSVCTIMFYILYNAANIYSNIWLSDWSNDATKFASNDKSASSDNSTISDNSTTPRTVDTAQRDLRLGVYGLLGFVQGVFIVGAALSLYIGNVRAGLSIHKAMLSNIVASPMHFFDTTPVGRILNRFGKDIDTIDTVLAHNMQMWLTCFLRVITVPVIVGYSTPLFLTTAVPMFIFYFIVQEYFLLVSLFIGNVRAGRRFHKAMLSNAVASPMHFFDTTPVGRILNRFGVLESICAFLMATCGIRASRKLFYNLFHNILRLPMKFHDVNPRGRVLNITSEDIEELDFIVPFTLRSMCNVVLMAVGTLGVIVGSVHMFVVVIPPFAVIYFYVQRFYVATSRQLKRLESVSRSPIYSHFGETVTGVVTVRAYKQQDRFIEISENKVDNNLVCHYPSIISNRWLAIRLEFVGNCIVFFASLFAVIARDTMSPGIVGLSITYALSVTQTLNWMVRMTTELETNIVAVERVKEYSETPTEADWVVKDNRPSAEWPDKGLVQFENYGTRYREGMDLVIKGIDCTVQPGEKIGIVGRTGAGKSSLTLALFRIIEPAQGKIKIDGIDIGQIGLHDLRSKLTIIPQEPVLFSGSLRMNLDPFGEHSDDAVWQALEHAHLKSFVSGLPTTLEHECTEGGENLSVGQRQLVCLARALLRKTKILILDEATAAVDLETDDLIQHTIRVEFANATVLTIAHRLNTIMDYTRVMVLDQGKIKEFDSPQALLQNEDSIFYGMAKDAGLA